MDHPEVSSIVIDGNIEAVWDAITSEDKLIHWYAPGSPWEIPSLAAGEKMLFTLMPNQHNNLAEKLPMFLTIEKVIPNQEFSFVADSQQTVITFILEQESRGTRVACNMGFRESLANLKAFIEGKEIPYT